MNARALVVCFAAIVVLGCYSPEDALLEDAERVESVPQALQALAPGMVKCKAGFAECNGSTKMGDRCETNITNNTNHCGGCGITCSFANAGATCTNSACVMGACNAGFANCDSNSANGCEISTASDLANCGACGNACNGTNGTATCSSGTCGIICNAGFGNCDGNAGTGCEVDLSSDAANCGACGTVCAPGQTCGSGTCATPDCLLLCDDGNPCTDDFCDPFGGCVHTIADGAPCNDANACTQTDLCSAGVCVGSNPVVCPVGTCNPADGTCS